ncbi:MAG: hypothetical protein J6C01_07600 [Lachnospiraceae bacterium]|nr:hypothetical protein [Lachnospiraceae bacterium]
MSKKSIEDVMNEIEDFLNSCKTSALSSNKVVVPRDEFDELFGDLKVKIPAEIDRCKKIMRNKEAILMEARKNADGIIAQASAQANQMVSETEIMNMANQQAYETVEMARAQANDILAQAVEEANQIRLGSMQYTNDIMTGLRNYMQATMEAERANYENLISAFNNECMIANANLEEVQRQIVEFTGDPNSIQTAPQFKTAANGKSVPTPPKAKNSMVQKMKQAVGGKDEKIESKPVVDIPDFVATGEKVVPNETPLEPKKTTVSNTTPAVATGSNSVNAESTPMTNVSQPASKPVQQKPVVQTHVAAPTDTVKEETIITEQIEADGTKKIKKKIIKRRNPVIQTPQTAQETVAKTVEAVAAAKVDKTVYKANGEQARAAADMEGRVKRGPRVGRGMVEENAQSDNPFEVTTQPMESVTPQESGKSMGVIDDYAMDKKF